MKRLVLTAALCLAAAPAFAFHCPADMARIDAALDAGPALSEAEMSQVRALRAEGERLHMAGQHQQSVDTLAEALRILGVD